jgi:hypothetical protein
MSKSILIKMLLLLVLLSFGCASRHRIDDSLEPAKQKGPMEISTDLQLKPHEFAEEIARLEAMISKNTDLSFQIRAHLRLALLYLDNKNPKPNFLNAIKELEIYVSMDSEGGKRAEIQNLLRVLRELGRLSDENKKIKVKIELVVTENEEIKKTVEELRKLDLKIEERRRQIK